MPKIKSISCRRILNSHVDFTNEFVVELDDGSLGKGGAPQGETISIYEDKSTTTDTAAIIDAIKQDGFFNTDLDQQKLDIYLQEKIPEFGRNNVCALSLAFFDATAKTRSVFELFDRTDKNLHAPAICMNVLNGGWHAYTNPVLSDFHEYILVSRGNDIPEIIEDHNRVQAKVREKLVGQTKTVVSGNPVNRFEKTDNLAPAEFLLDIVDGLQLNAKYDLMIDASAGDLYSEEGYRFSLTDDSLRSSDELCEYWMTMINDYRLRFLEDPLHEQDYDSWNKLTTMQDKCCVIGDNFYSSDAQRVKEGADNKYTNAVLVKPNQAGTVTAVKQTIKTAHDNGQIAITSHRSISTESTFLATLTCMFDVKYVKIGPLLTDFSSIVRLNEIIRLTES